MTQNRPQYADARDGRFLINQPVGDANAAPITLILHWRGGLSARSQSRSRSPTDADEPGVDADAV